MTTINLKIKNLTIATFKKKKKKKLIHFVCEEIELIAVCCTMYR